LKYKHTEYSTPKYVHGGYRSEITGEFKMPFTSILALYVSDVMTWLGTGSKCYLYTDVQNLHNIIKMKTYNVLN